ncbi:helix-turn-helix domain-containing protein [bacterium]|nr:helix-turn-helix domain-containing protein [bacterium]
MLNENNQSKALAYSPREVANQLRISRTFIYQLIRENRIPHLKIGTKILIPTKEFEAWMAKRTKGSEPEQTDNR